jgi:hypothetical protein
MEMITEQTTRPAYEALCGIIGRILKLPPRHETTRLVAHSVIAQIKHFGDPECSVGHLDPTIMHGKTDQDLASSIVSFSLAGPYPHRMASRTAKGKRRKSDQRPKQKKAPPVER